MKPNRSKCIWAACIAAIAVCMTINVKAADNLGHGYVSSVTSGTNCVYSDTNGGGIQFWDIQAGGTYTVTLSGVDDAANTGMDPTMQVIVHNSAGGNQCVQATSTVEGVYTFTITLGAQCLTMPIEYGTLTCNPKSPNCVATAGCAGFGIFAQDNVGGVAGGHEGHLRTTIFDENCNKVSDDTTCQGGGGSTGSITVCKYFDNNANGFQDTGEASLTGWPFCINPLDGGTPALVTQLTANGGCATWSNLTTPGDYVVTEANANESNWFHSTGGTSMIMLASGGSETRTFGNYCTSPSGGLTLGFWSNKNGNKIITGNSAGNGTTLLPAVVTLLNSCQLVNANGTIHTFNNNYSQYRSGLLVGTATNMAYMLSVQLAALKLDVAYVGVDGNAFDLCSHMTVNGLIGAACDSMTGPGNQLTLAGNPSRPGQEMLKNCIDKINNNGDVIPVTPCPFSFPNPPAPCP
jgi:hypothetical protein